MTGGEVVVVEEEDAGDSNNTLESGVLLLHEIYGDDVFNKADNLIEDAPPLPNATQGTQFRQKRRRKGSQNFEK